MEYRFDACPSIRKGVINLKDVSIRIEQVENGYTVSHSWDEKNEKTGDDDYQTEEWVFLNKEDALKKAQEILK